MKFQLIDADIVSLRIAQKKRRMDDITRELMKVISNLGPDQAKAIIPEGDESVKKLAAKLRAASKAVDIKVKVAVRQDRVTFALAESFSGSQRNRARIGKVARTKRIHEIARNLGDENGTVTSVEILKAIEDEGFSFDDMSRPNTMVSTILRNMPEFERMERKVFKYKGKIEGAESKIEE